MSDGTPKWLLVMRGITGLTETPGDADNPKILAMRDYIAKTFPDQAAYCAEYRHDETPWCGLTAAFCMAVCNIKGPFGPTDTDRWMWALSWSEDNGYSHLSRPSQGCVVVMEREGGGHVTLFEEWDGDRIKCRGGNQSDAVNVQTYDTDQVVAYVWPKAAGDMPQPDDIPVEDRPMLERGDTGSDVFDLQEMLPHFQGDVDGDFGSVTEQAVTDYQRTRGLEVDGVVGQETWNALYDDKPPLPPPAPPPGAFTLEQQKAIKKIADDSNIADYSWKDRGYAPTGWNQGMALAFAQTYRKLKANNPSAVQMAQKRMNSDKDALNVYRDDYKRLGMSNETSGIDTLRHLYALMLGHGMRESSGEHCCGRDQSADNVSSDTAEAGAFQTSYNAHSASSPEFDNLMDEYLRGLSPGYLDAFAEDVSCSEADWENYGSGRGEQFQDLCKKEPAFSAESAALTLRNLCNHYGPIIRKEVELKQDADLMFKKVQDYVDSIEPVVA